jgi:hypothetical protein
VVDLFDEASLQQLADLFTDEVLPLNGLLPWLLSHRPGIGVDLQMVLNHLPGILGICDGSQVNMSTFAWRKAMSVLSYFSPRFPPMGWSGRLPLRPGWSSHEHRPYQTDGPWAPWLAPWHERMWGRTPLRQLPGRALLPAHAVSQPPSRQWSGRSAR